MYRIGFARDIHRLVKNKKLMLAGIEIKSTLGEDAYSDGDVVLHAISEAMLGALALGDLGEHFPNSNKKYKGIASKHILDACYKMIKKKGYKIVNIDISIELEKPKIKDDLLLMRKNLAKLLKIKLDQISIKANTNERMDAIGENKAVAANAIILLKKEK